MGALHVMGSFPTRADVSFAAARFENLRAAAGSLSMPSSPALSSFRPDKSDGSSPQSWASLQDT